MTNKQKYKKNGFLMRDDDIVLDLDSLKKITFCAYIMSAIDNDIHEAEEAVIKRFVSESWNDDFGDIDLFYREIDEQVVHFLVPEKGKMTDIEKHSRFKEEISKQMNAETKEILMRLVVRVMDADEVIKLSETELLQSFVKNI